MLDMPWNSSENGSILEHSTEKSYERKNTFRSEKKWCNFEQEIKVNILPALVISK